jgi:glutamate dehydrogenase
MDDHDLALRPLWERIEAVLPPQRAALACPLAQASYRLTPERRLRELDLDDAARLLDRALRFIDQRLPGIAVLRVRPEGGEDTGGTLVEIGFEDTPFLLSTLKAELEQLRLDPIDVVHPVFGVRRDAEGRLLEILPARGAQHVETYMLLRLPRRLDGPDCANVTGRLETVLGDLRRATRDYQRMSERLAEVRDEIWASAGSRFDPSEVREVVDLLDWLRRGRFIMLGFAAYEVVSTGGSVGWRMRPGSGLGILDDASGTTDAAPEDALDPGDHVERGRLLFMSRTTRLSTIHRRVPMVCIGVRQVCGDATIGEFRLLGMYAQKALVEPSSAIPVLRRTLKRIVEGQDLVEGSYDERALRRLFDSFPKHELFETGPDELGRVLVELLEASRRRVPRVLLRLEPARHRVSALVALPRARLSEIVLLRIRRLLDDRLDGLSDDYRLTLIERDMALLAFRAEGAKAFSDEADLEREIAAFIRTFHDDLENGLAAVYGRQAARRTLELWGPSLPAGYTDGTDVATAMEDLAALERLERGEGVVITIRPDRTGQADQAERSRTWHVRLYRPGPSVEPSRVLPLLESLGLRVVEEVPHRLAGTPLGEVHIHDYAVRVEHDLDAGDQARIARAALALWNNRAEIDSLNRLVVRARMEWDDVAVLRAYRQYRRQLGTSFTKSYINDALITYPQVARALIDYFAARLAPEGPESETAGREHVSSALETVQRLDADRILRGFLNLIDATLRTNRWVREAKPPEGGDHEPTGPRADALALKIESRLVSGMPRPVPHVEIFVYAPAVEGVHLRGAAVARGGIRYSDRVEDFRTEILGLMKAQMLKNAVIVPSGSKGGFVLKRPSPDPADLPLQIRCQYATYVRALLDVTDNIVGGVVVHPPGVRCRDGEDAYLVVAPDRGTATFSDLANAIGEEYGFWLGDAFASGGSHGYDHKAMGVTARGVWVAVRRHFWELGVDVQTEPITVAGVGDMSGDVFGNGLLRSRAVKLVAAFDYRDIFLDPDPDPGRAFAERARLFALPGSSWQDYDRDALSPGGGVWPRTAVTIPLAEPVRRLLGVDAERMSPPELIRAILCARVDLLFFGGIGTFVKASGETDAEVGDRANEEVRVDASRVRARVIGEGANLGITQRGRIEYARRGGRCNTDAIDNSAGVATSDREVNLKILLAIAAEAEAIDPGERDAMLRAMQDDVSRAVTRDVYLQTWAISQELAFSPGGIQAYEQLMADLVAAGRLDRQVEALPETEEIQRRRTAGAGLARPEIAVLLGHAKVDLTTRLLDSSLPDQSYLQSTLRAYFPRLAVERFGDLLERHPLRRELIATAVANDVVDHMGVTWVNRTSSEFACTASEAVSAYWVAREVAGTDELYALIEALDGRGEPMLQLELKSSIDELIDVYARTYLRHASADADIAIGVAMDGPAFHELEKALLSGVGSDRHRGSRTLAQRYDDLGLDPDVAQRLAILPDLQLVPDVAAVARASGRSVPHVWEVFVGLAAALLVDLLHQRLRRITPVGRWERWQHHGLFDELAVLGRAATARAISEHPDQDPSEVVHRFRTTHRTRCERAATLIRMLDPEPSLHAVAVAVRALRDVV